MTTAARRGAWLLTALLVVLVVLAAVVLVRLMAADRGPGGVVDGNTPAVAGARVASESLKQAALDAAEVQYADESAEVVGSGIISVTDSDAKVLLFVDTPAEGAERESLKRIVVTLTRDSGPWRLTGDEAV